jgi:hypothetical protein
MVLQIVIADKLFSEKEHMSNLSVVVITGLFAFPPRLIETI